MRKLILFACVATLSSLLPKTGFAQSSGQKANLFMYFHNSDSNGVSAAVQGDTIGNLKWMALTQAPGTIRTAAEIRSFITGPVSASTLPANLVFRTGGAGLQNRMVITEPGRVGIGTMVPGFNLDVVGNTHTSGDFYGRIHFDDNQGTDDGPGTYTDEAYFERKQRSVLNLPAGPGVHGGLLSLAPGGSSFDHQLFFANDGIFTRRTDGNAADWSTATWYKLLTGEDIHGTTNRIAKFTGPSSLGDSRLFDDGTLVGIGTTSPNAAYLLTVAGNTRIDGQLHGANDAAFDQNLTVQGNVSVQQNVTATGNIQAGANLSAANNATVGNNLAVNNDALVQGDLSVDQTAHIGQSMTIGTNTNANGYLLSVGGGVIAEEVRVQLESAWPDYVFQPDYQLPNLGDLAQFVATNKHLPGIPSATEVAANGLDLGDMNRRLLEKVEELTLLLIEQQKQIDQLKGQIQHSGN